MTFNPEYLDKLNQWGLSDVSLPAWARSTPYKETVEAVIAAFCQAKVNKAATLNEFRELAGICVDVMLDAGEIAEHLSRLRAYDEYTFLHSLNVAVIAGLIGKQAGLSASMLRNLLLSGLLHDIGKQCIPRTILNKQGRLTAGEMAVIKQHARYGYELIKAMTLPDEIKIGVLQHHERLDGSGYPCGLFNGQISLFARIIAVADSYDAMTSERVYRAKMSPCAALQAIAHDMGHKLDSHIGMLFLAKVEDYFAGRTDLYNQKSDKDAALSGK